MPRMTPAVAVEGRDLAARSTTVRVSASTYEALKALSRAEGEPMARCLERLIREARERRMWEQYRQANEQLHANREASAAHAQEEALWSTADTDGLDPDDGVEWSEDLEDAASW